MVEYGILVAEMGLATMQTFTSSAELWLSRVNWKVVGYIALALIALRIVTWTVRSR
jgi:hypothetical protein